MAHARSQSLPHLALVSRRGEEQETEQEQEQEQDEETWRMAHVASPSHDSQCPPPQSGVKRAQSEQPRRGPHAKLDRHTPVSWPTVPQPPTLTLCEELLSWLP